MKTRQEIEKMKFIIQDKISMCDIRYRDASNSEREKLMDYKRQLMAQYNILLEVLK